MDYGEAMSTFIKRWILGTEVLFSSVITIGSLTLLLGLNFLAIYSILSLSACSGNAIQRLHLSRSKTCGPYR